MNDTIRRIMAALPKTADGATIVPNMSIWWTPDFGKFAGQLLELRIDTVGNDSGTPTAHADYGWEYTICIGRGHDEVVYSTREAALDAQKDKKH